MSKPRPLFIRRVDARRVVRRRLASRLALGAAGLLLLGFTSNARGGASDDLPDAPDAIFAVVALPASAAAPVSLSLAAPPTPRVCPTGFSPLGAFEVTGYALAQETEHAGGDTVTDPCGLEGTYPRDFLYGSGVRLQGSGRTADGRFVRYEGDNCFAEQECPVTAGGTCATGGRTVAVDSKLVPLGTRLWVQGIGERLAEDRGGAIRGRKLDVYFGGRDGLSKARDLGRVQRRVCVETAAG